MATQEEKEIALNIQHQMFLFDQILKVKCANEQLQLTLSWETPNEKLTQPMTFVLTKAFANQLADAIKKATK